MLSIVVDCLAPGPAEFVAFIHRTSNNKEK